MFLKLRSTILTAVFSVVATTVAVQFGWLGPQQPFLTNLISVAAIWGASHVLAYVIGKH
jgi:hypothetical protein